MYLLLECRRLSISKCFFLTADVWKRYWLEWINFSSITTFNPSHCYWLPAELLCETISSMSNLEELLVHDTKIELKHLSQLFKTCPKITRLSISLTEEQLSMYGDDYESVPALFKQLVSLDIFTFALNDKYYIDSWLAIFNILR